MEKTKVLTMTKKVVIFVNEDLPELRHRYYELLSDAEHMLTLAANDAISNLFVGDRVNRQRAARGEELIEFIGRKGKPTSFRNVAYTTIQNYLDTKPENFIAKRATSSVAQLVYKKYVDYQKKGEWTQSLPTYKHIPVPIPAGQFKELRFAEYVDGNGRKQIGVFFTMFNIPMGMIFRGDRQGNLEAVNRILNGELKLLTSSFQIINSKGKKPKMLLSLCVQGSKQDVGVDPGKTLYAYVGMKSPIVCSTRPVNIYNNPQQEAELWSVGDYESFVSFRVGLQMRRRRMQAAMKYTNGGRGRKRKCTALDNIRALELKFSNGMMHKYSREIVDLAAKHRCGKIEVIPMAHMSNAIMKQKDEQFRLRNFSLYDLKLKIKDKAARLGITLIDNGANAVDTITLDHNVSFNADACKLYHDGQQLRGITSMLKTGSNASNDFTFCHHNAADYGKMLHTLIEAYELYGAGYYEYLADSVKWVDIETLKSIADKYSELRKGIDGRFLESEYACWGGGTFGTMIDFVFVGNNNKAVLVEIKTNTEYPEEYLRAQMSIQREFFQFTNKGIKVAQCLCLWIPRGRTEDAKLLTVNADMKKREINAILAGRHAQ